MRRVNEITRDLLSKDYFDTMDIFTRSKVINRLAKIRHNLLKSIGQIL